MTYIDFNKVTSSTGNVIIESDIDTKEVGNNTNLCARQVDVCFVRNIQIISSSDTTDVPVTSICLIINEVASDI